MILSMSEKKIHLRRGKNHSDNQSTNSKKGFDDYFSWQTIHFTIYNVNSIRIDICCCIMVSFCYVINLLIAVHYCDFQSFIYLVILNTC